VLVDFLLGSKQESPPDWRIKPFTQNLCNNKLRMATSIAHLLARQASVTQALFCSSKNQKVFKILCHIESYGTCMKH
jgi:hypothetical protein